MGLCSTNVLMTRALYHHLVTVFENQNLTHFTILQAKGDIKNVENHPCFVFKNIW